MINQPIILNGFMGVGKTTIAKKLARSLNYDFIDIDDEIINAFNLPVTEIFRQYGEAKFREKETELIKLYSNRQSTVISLGGGAFKNLDNRQACLDNGIVIHLDLSYKEWQKRIPELISTRPILQNKTDQAIKELYEARQSIYHHRDLHIMTDNLSKKEVTEHIINKLKMYDQKKS